MTAKRTIQLSLHLDADGDPIAGRLVERAGERPFVGWLALIAALEEARKQGRGALGSYTELEAGTGTVPDNV